MARRVLHRYGRESIDGMEAHDFAVESLQTVPWMPGRVAFDVIDAIRRERGRKGDRTRVWEQAEDLSGFAARTDSRHDPEWIASWSFLTGRQLEIAVLCSGGIPVSGIATRLGITENAVYRQLKSIARKYDRNASDMGGRRTRCRGTTAPST